MSLEEGLTLGNLDDLGLAAGEHSRGLGEGNSSGHFDKSCGDFGVVVSLLGLSEVVQARSQLSGGAEMSTEKDRIDRKSTSASSRVSSRNKQCCSFGLRG